MIYLGARTTIKPKNVMQKSSPRFDITFLLTTATLLISACQLPNHHLIHPDSVPTMVDTWSEDYIKGELMIHLAWAKPKGDGPFATVLVHPHGGKTTKELRGVIWDLAQHGFLAVAADYKRFLDDEYKRNTFMWRAESDVTEALNIVKANPYVDAERIAALGFSQGGMLSLLIAAYASEQLKTVVAYYPVSDFIYWFEKERRNFIEDGVFAVIRYHFYQESDAQSEDEFLQILRDASPINHAENIDVPVLLVHGDADTSARLEESQRLQAKLQEYDKAVELLVVPGGVHIFNFRQQQQAEFAWQYTIQWLRRYLQ
ncbi:alpha/beta hydrolase family protein [Kaarinaea lacus]